MPEGGRITLRVNGRSIAVDEMTTVAAAILAAGERAFRRSVTGEPRAPLCGMGICYECRATIDGVPHRRTCQTYARDGMEVTTDGRA
jgi:sarcosine oxidase subunit alpha